MRPTPTALGPDERKIAALFAAFGEINGRVDKAVSRFERTVGGVDSAVRQSVGEAAVQELAGLSDQAQKTTASLEGLRKAADWRQLLLGIGLSLVVVLLTFLGSWLYLPSSAEMSRLRAEERHLQASLDQLGSHGGRSQGSPHECSSNDRQHSPVEPVRALAARSEVNRLLSLPSYVRACATSAAFSSEAVAAFAACALVRRVRQEVLQK